MIPKGMSHLSAPVQFPKLCFGSAAWLVWVLPHRTFAICLDFGAICAGLVFAADKQTYVKRSYFHMISESFAVGNVNLHA